MSVDQKVQIKMRASVGTLRAHNIYWIEPERAARLVDGGHATYVAAPEPVSIIDAVTTVAAEMRDQHRMNTDPADALEQVKEVQADGAKTDQSKGAPRSRRRAGNGNGGSDSAGRLDEQADGKQG